MVKFTSETPHVSTIWGRVKEDEMFDAPAYVDGFKLQRLGIATPSDAPAETHVFLIIGQSNSTPLSAFDGGVDWPSNVRQLERWQTPLTGSSLANGQTAIPTASQSLIAASRPMHAHTGSTTGFGFTLQFVIEYRAANPNAEIVLIPCGHGSTGFRDEGGTPGRWNRGQDLYQDAVDRTNKVFNDNPDFIFKGVLFHQGERDSDNATNAAAHINHVMSMRNDMITDVDRWTGEIPFIVGGLVPSFVSDNPNRQVVQDNLKRVPDLIAYSGYADPDSPTVLGGDGGNGAAHFSPSGYRGMGSRYFTAYNEAVINELAPPLSLIDQARSYALFGNDNQAVGNTITAETGTDLTLTGSLTYEDGYVNLPNDPNTGIDTGFVQTIDSTMIVVARVPNNGNKFIIGNFSDDAPRQTIFKVAEGFRHNFIGDVNPNSRLDTTVQGDDVFKFIAVTQSATDRLMYIRDSETPTVVSDTFQNELNTANSIALGPLYWPNASGWANPWDAAAALVFDRVLTEVELGEIYETLVMTLAARNVTLGSTTI